MPTQTLKIDTEVIIDSVLPKYYAFMTIPPQPETWTEFVLQHPEMEEHWKEGIRCAINDSLPALIAAIQQEDQLIGLELDETIIESAARADYEGNSGLLSYNGLREGMKQSIKARIEYTLHLVMLEIQQQNKA